MIDLTTETVISLTEAAKILPIRRAGKRPHVATLHRWASRGLHGVQLDTIQVGGTRCTSVAALQRFFDALSAPTSTVAPRSNRSRAHTLKQAAQKLKDLGL